MSVSTRQKSEGNICWESRCDELDLSMPDWMTVEARDQQE